ncbi:MAG: VWA domain-containing protein, partial [Fusobacteria bacterium]|nr:VWA domain-containing protein [Fusobacteriota bacterium]
MASRDRNPNVASELRAKVMDARGNPVDGEEVTFTIDNDTIINVGESTPDGIPYLGEVEGQNKTSVVTSDGSATTKFHPGSFAKPDAKKVASSKGNVTVWATWGDVREPIELTWVNYPYLSVETFVSNDKISVNSTDEHMTNTTYVTIRVKGDGYAMQPDPIDAVLVIDRSGSMKWNITEDNGTSNERMEAAKDAASTFINQMNSTSDRVGLVSFSSTARRDVSLTNNKAILESKANGLIPSGATNMRQAFYEAISHLDSKGRSEAVKAVILMSDGDWNHHGSPLAHGIGLRGWTWSGNTITHNYYEYYGTLDGGTLTSGQIDVPIVKNGWGEDGSYDYVNEYVKSYYLNGESTNQNMSNYAIAKNTSLYTITFAFEPDEEIRTAMRILANSTGGFYEHAGDGEQLTSIYKRIAGELKNEASVDTNMTVFQNVEVNGTPIAAYTIFDYKHEDHKSTTIHGWVNNTTGDYPNIPPFKTINQTEGWKQDKRLHFNISTIQLGQTWETTFRLVVNAS